MFGTAQARERAQVFGELASMVHAGVSIGESLTAVAEEMPQSRMQRALRMVGHDVSGGRSLGESLKRYSDVFSPLTLAMVEVGERGGRIEESLRNIADYFEREFRLRSLLRRELTYPIILLIAILFIPLAGRMIVVWLNDSVTAAIITGIRQLLVYLIVFGLPALGAWLVVRSLRQSHEGRLRIDRIKLSIPLIGTVMRKLALARFCRALASLYSAGVMMSTSLRLAGEASANEVLKTELGG
ncbi:MAG: type II secretion system F family protein, partial [Armatimonadota bacterium]